MSDLTVSQAPSLGARLPRATLLYAVVGGAGLAGLLAGRWLQGGPGDMEWQLVLLLRFMAVVKGAMALGALALVQWRLRQPASARLALGYVVALAPMALAPGLIWSLAAIAPGAACFHAGLLLFLVLTWRDDGVSLPTRASR
ncbi:MAG: hypothetical protein INR64_16370 [Caulobacteraceae bacterium]|nr:hypothetical protein [Caulobacter sp.]